MSEWVEMWARRQASGLEAAIHCVMSWCDTR